MTDIQLTPGDRLRLEVLLKSLAQGGTHLAVLSEHDLVLDHLANLIDERLRAQTDCTVEFCFSTNAERLVQKFNDILSELTLDQALDKDRTHAPRRYLVFRDSILVQDSELLLLARLVNGFPASNIGVILLVNSVGSHRHKLEAFGKSLVQWPVETRAGPPRQVIDSLVADPPDIPMDPPVVHEVIDPATLGVASTTPQWRIPDPAPARSEPLLDAPGPAQALSAEPAAEAMAQPRQRGRGRGWWLLAPLLSLLVLGWLYRDALEQEYQALRTYLLRGTPAPAVQPAPVAPQPPAPVDPAPSDPEEEVLPSPRAAAAMQPPPEPATPAPTATPAPPLPEPAAVPASPTPAPVAPASAPAKAPAAQVSAASDEAWLEQLSAGGYVVQLAAFDTEAEILNFQRSDPVYAKARVVRVQRKDSNKRYYVLIAGPMATKAQAEAFMQSHRLLAKAWLRTAKSLKAQL